MKKKDSSYNYSKESYEINKDNKDIKKNRRSQDPIALKKQKQKKNFTTINSIL